MARFDRPPEVDEKIQMHADTLYHRMLDQEKAIAEAKASGLPVPSFPPIISSSSPSASSSPSSETSDSTKDKQIRADQLKPSIQKQLKRQLDSLTPEEREIEEKAIAAEIAAGERLIVKLDSLQEERAKNRKERKEQGKSTFGDKITEWFSLG